jgi:hypothetical protein
MNDMLGSNIGRNILLAKRDNTARFKVSSRFNTVQRSSKPPAEVSRRAHEVAKFS